MKSNAQMPHYFSLYLDIVRFCAAVAVFLNHIASDPFTKDVFWWPLGAYGGSAVIMFFVLSGYVIAYVTSTRENSFPLYAAARIARIYSVVLIALLLTFTFDNIGLTLNPEFYSIQKIMWKPQSIEGYVASILFVNEYQAFNFGGISPGSNGPYWSLSFEMTYYLIAGLALFASKWIALPISLLVLLLAGRTITALFPIWLLGYLLYSVELKNANRKVLYCGLICSVLLIAITPYLARHIPSDNFGMYFPWGRGPFNRELLNDYLSALFFAVNMVCVREILKGSYFPIERSVEKAIKRLGSLTFPLYLIHFPALAFFSSTSHLAKETIGNAIYIGMLTFIVVIVVIPISDRLKCKINRGLLGVFVAKGERPITS